MPVLNKTPQTWFQGMNIWAYPTPDHDDNVARYFSGTDAPFPMLFISFPRPKTPISQTALLGHSTIEVITLAP
jgi:all-trans-retinol 13,14-reductase